MAGSRSRDGMGRFVKGNPGGPGRPRSNKEEKYLAAMSEACDEEAWQAIVLRATQDAINGDAKARTWLSDYLVGPPTIRIVEKPLTQEFLRKVFSDDPVEDADLEE